VNEVLLKKRVLQRETNEIWRDRECVIEDRERERESDSWKKVVRKDRYLIERQIDIFVILNSLN
jgi:hypothetical protein